MRTSDDRPTNHIEPAGTRVDRGTSRTDYVPLLRMANIVLEYRLWILAITLAIPSIVCGFTLLQARTYTANASFTPHSQQPNSQLIGLSAQLGIAIPNAQSSESPAFYASFLRSRGVLRAVASTPYKVGDTDTTSSLSQLLEVEAETPERTLERTVIELGRRLDATATRETGVVNLSVRTRSPSLSKQVANRFLEIVNDFNVSRRQSQYTSERRFVEQRLDEAQNELRHSEDRLQQFLAENAGFRTSSSLSFQHDRLQRDVVTKQQVYSTLSESYERARIEEVRNTPVITTIETPELPIFPDRRSLIIKGFLSLMAGAFLGIAAAISWELTVASSRLHEPDEVERFMNLRSEIGRQINRFIRPRSPGKTVASARSGDGGHDDWKERPR